MKIPDKKGRVTLITGPMFAGKTTEMIKLTRRHQFGASARTIHYIKHSFETRCPKGLLRSHDDLEVDGMACDSLIEYATHRIEEDTEPGVVGIDEGQFFPDLVKGCDLLVSSGYHVYVAALSGTFAQKPWDNVAELSPKADHVVYLVAVCYECGKDAPFSYLCNREGVTGDVMIGGAEKYHSLCRDCLGAQKDATLPI
jgi:thymidine kinase